MDLQLIDFDQPTETRHVEKGRFDVAAMSAVVVNRLRRTEVDG